MEKLNRSDIVSNDEYLKERGARRERILGIRKLRRIEVGPHLSFTFENRETVKYQIQEMMRVEHITDLDKIQHEIDVYNELIPAAGRLSATMFIEVTDQEQLRTVLDSMQGLDKPRTVFMTIDGEQAFAEFEPGHSTEERISAVHYVQFQLTPGQIRKFKSAEVQIRVQHPSYKATATFNQEQKEEISKDLE